MALRMALRRQVAMGRLPQAERCARRALLLYALAYDFVVMDDETRTRIAELEGHVEPGELRDEAPGNGTGSARGP